MIRSPEEEAHLQSQIALSKSLALGFALSLLPVAGIGSVAAIWIGLRARRKIEASAGALVGGGMAAWCVVVGTLGLIANVVLLGPLILGIR